ERLQSDALVAQPGVSTPTYHSLFWSLAPSGVRMKSLTSRTAELVMYSPRRAPPSPSPPSAAKTSCLLPTSVLCATRSFMRVSMNTAAAPEVWRRISLWQKPGLTVSMTTGVEEGKRSLKARTKKTLRTGGCSDAGRSGKQHPYVW
ncbi:unnamed protein product, partial [Mycena citricolor]